jgi:hypothetical protein
MKGGKSQDRIVTHQEIMLGVFKDHVNGFILQYDLFEGDHILVRYFFVQLHLVRQ